jgi:diguanylate cyclase (GGDEF)-like protein
VIPGPARVTQGDLEAALWRLLDASGSEDATAFLDLHEDVREALADSGDPCWIAWRHVLAARRAVLDGRPDAASPEVAAAREALDTCPPDATTALTLAYLAHVEVTADHVDAAMQLAVDASLLTEHVPPADGAGRALHQAHRWLSLTLSGLDLEEHAVEHAVRGHAIAATLPSLAEQWRMLVLAAHQHAELAQTLHRRGRTLRAHELAAAALGHATDARRLGFEPEPHDQYLLDVVQAWAMTCSDQLHDALGPLRRAHRRVHADGGLWLRGFTDLALGRLLARLAERDPRHDPVSAMEDDEPVGDRPGEEAVQLLVDAAGAFVAAGDRRRYRQCLLELGRLTAALGRPAEALHWLEAYRADTGRAHTRSRQLWAEMFVRRSRLREAERQAALLRRHALEDPLTGLGNRRSAERRLGSLPLGEEPLSLAVVDVDRFKEVNDEASHSHGDAVLRRVADLLREHSRTGDEVFRWAGDEFLVVLPTATEEQAVVVMERLRAAVAGADWRDLQVPEPVTVSIGVASAPASEEGARAGWRALFDTADLHLFSAKRSGRNRVRAPGGPPPEPGA